MDLICRIENLINLSPEYKKILWKIFKCTQNICDTRIVHHLGRVRGQGAAANGRKSGMLMANAWMCNKPLTKLNK